MRSALIGAGGLARDELAVPGIDLIRACVAADRARWRARSGERLGVAVRADDSGDRAAVAALAGRPAQRAVLAADVHRHVGDAVAEPLAERRAHGRRLEVGGANGER